MKNIILILFTFLFFGAFAQNSIDHIEPPFWWYDMENKQVELLLHGNDVGNMSCEITDPNINIVSQVSENKNYIFLLLDFSQLQEQKDITITLKNEEKRINIPYSFRKKRTQDRRSIGISSKDAIYLITPDRFKNGNEKNDQLAQYMEGIDRSDPYGRHGGDIEGIIASLDYISSLGFTSIWLNPVLENNMKSQSYHGYATTNFYEVDERFGGMKAYEELRDKMEEKGLHLIMDMIANHCGSNHWWMNDLPFQDWVHHSQAYKEGNINQYLTNHRKSSLIDPYGSAKERQRMLDGWFVPSMPDMNQSNVHMARYLIQNSIWWVEHMNLAGIRQDTYSYPYEKFLSEWSCALKLEFPNLFIVGEEWSDNPLITSYWQQKDNSEINSEASCLPSVMDFPLQVTVNQALIDNESWNKGLAKMYEILANDILYSNPNQLVILPDNHDMSRIYTQLNENINLWKMAMIYYATMRGIPQIYYGTEILYSNPGTESHGVIRKEMLGGWKDHDQSVFLNENLSQEESDALEFIKTLYTWRKAADEVHNGKLLHFEPRNGVYVYFRYTNDSKVMVVLNKNDKKQIIPLERFDEIINSDISVFDVISGNKLEFNKNINIPGQSALIWEILD